MGCRVACGTLQATVREKVYNRLRAVNARYTVEMNRSLNSEETPASGGGRLPVNGRQRLIEAAMRLAAQHGGIGAVGMRELAREAGLNPNTFYRHFDSMDDLAIAAVDTVMPPLREGLRALRMGTLSFAKSSRATTEFFFDFVVKHPEAVMLAARELYGASPALRERLRQSIAEITEDLVEAILRNGWAPFAGTERVREMSDTIIKQFFALGIDLAQRPESRTELVERADRFVLVTCVGAYLVDTLGLTPEAAFDALGSGVASGLLSARS